MACCAFAVFLLLNLLAPLRWLRRLAGSRTSRTDAAVAWRPGQADVSAHAAPPRWRRAVAGAVAVELLMLVALAAFWLAPAPPAGTNGPATIEEWDAFVALHTVWCGRDDAPERFELTSTER